MPLTIYDESQSDWSTFHRAAVPEDICCIQPGKRAHQAAVDIDKFNHPQRVSIQSTSHDHPKEVAYSNTAQLSCTGQFNRCSDDEGVLGLLESKIIRPENSMFLFGRQTGETETADGIFHPSTQNGDHGHIASAPPHSNFLPSGSGYQFTTYGPFYGEILKSNRKASCLSRQNLPYSPSSSAAAIIHCPTFTDRLTIPDYSDDLLNRSNGDHPYNQRPNSYSDLRPTSFADSNDSCGAKTQLRYVDSNSSPYRPKCVTSLSIHAENSNVSSREDAALPDFATLNPMIESPITCPSTFTAHSSLQSTFSSFQQPDVYMQGTITPPPSNRDRTWLTFTSAALPMSNNGAQHNSVEAWLIGDPTSLNYLSPHVDSASRLRKRTEPCHFGDGHRAILDMPQPLTPNSAGYLTRRDGKDIYLLEKKKLGWTYKEIRERGNFLEAESTLRGRYRALTKPMRDRVRKPIWTSIDETLLLEAVNVFITVKNFQAHGKAIDPEKVPWKKVADYIRDHGGTYRFGNSTTKKKWLELVN